MPDFLGTVDRWFLVVAVVVLGGYFLWSIKNMFHDLQDSIRNLQQTIKELFEHRNDHEVRLTAIETKCDMFHRRSNDK